jgi:dTDP-4-dehydrorhamnose 3,5-epimerase
MGAIGLDGIQVIPLARIATAGGDVMHAMKQTDAGYAGFGEAYFSWVDAGAVKAWKRHNRMTMNIVVPFGQVRFVFCAGVGTRFREEVIGGDRYARLTVPPGIWFGFQGLVGPSSLLLNLASIPHDPTESERCGLSELQYDWN